MVRQAATKLQAREDVASAIDICRVDRDGRAFLTPVARGAKANLEVDLGGGRRPECRCETGFSQEVAEVGCEMGAICDITEARVRIVRCER